MTPDELLRFKLKVSAVIGEILVEGFENEYSKMNLPEYMAAEVLALAACVFVDSGFSEQRFIAMARTSWTLARNGDKPSGE